MTSEEIKNLAKQTAQNCKLNKSIIAIHKREKRSVDISVPVLSITGFINKKIVETNTKITENVDVWIKEPYSIDGWILEDYFYAERDKEVNNKMSYYARYYFVLTASGEIKVLNVIEKNMSSPSSYSYDISWENARFDITRDSFEFNNSIYFLDRYKPMWDQDNKNFIAYWNYKNHNKCFDYSDFSGEGICKKLKELADKSVKIRELQKDKEETDNKKEIVIDCKSYSDDELAKIFSD